MTTISKDISISVERPTDYNNDEVYILVDAKGYDCQYILEGLGDERLQKGVDYQINGSVITSSSTYFPTNDVKVSIVSPAVDDNNLKFALRKIFHIEEPLNGIPLDMRKKYIKSKIVNLE